MAKPINPAAPSVRLSTTAGSANPRLPPSVKPNTSPNRPPVTSAAPAQSIPPVAVSPRLSGTRQRAITTTSAASGRLRKKIHRQETSSTSHAPRSGPSPAAIELNPAQVPIARPRFSTLKFALMSARLPGTSKAAPMPWTPRARMSWVTSGANPAPGGRRSEDRDTADEDGPPPPAVAEGAADEHQRGEEQHVGFDDPLHLAEAGAEPLAKHRQRNIHHAAVDEGHARPDHGHREHGARGRRGALARRGPGTSEGFVAGEPQPTRALVRGSPAPASRSPRGWFPVPSAPHRAGA